MGSKILVQLEMNEIRIYDFPESELRAEDNWMRSLLPFAVVGSNTTLAAEDGTKYRGREYPWGTVNIEDQGHCDFSPLRHLLLATHMQDLKEMTHGTHYENFRREKLNIIGGQEVEEYTGRDTSTDLNTIGLQRHSFMKGKRLWNKTNSVSLQEL